MANIDLKQLLKDLNYVDGIYDNKGDTRYKVLLLQLYVEHFMNEIIAIKSGDFPKEVIKQQLHIPTKSQMLLSWQLIEQSTKEIIDVLAKTRNDLAHNLIVDQENLVKRLKKVDFDFVRDDKGKKLRLFQRLGPLSQLSFSSILIISHLYQKFETLKGNKPSQYVRFQIKEENKEIVHTIYIMEMAS